MQCPTLWPGMHCAWHYAQDHWKVSGHWDDLTKAYRLRQAGGRVRRADYRADAESSTDGLERKRGRKPNPSKALEKKVVKLERENQRLRAQLTKAETILDVQGKVAGLLGFNLSDGSNCS